VFALDGKELHGHAIQVAVVTEPPLGRPSLYCSTCVSTSRLTVPQAPTEPRALSKYPRFPLHVAPTSSPRAL
jgi:hypothetical protein